MSKKKEISNEESKKILDFLGDEKNFSEEKLKKFLKEHHYDINVKDEEGYNLLHLAALSGNIRAFETVVKLGGDVNARNNDNDSVASLVWENGDNRVVSTMLHTLRTNKKFKPDYDENIRKHTEWVDRTEENQNLMGFEAGGDISLIKPAEKDQEFVEAAELKESKNFSVSWHKGNPFAINNVLVHEGNHALHTSEDVYSDYTSNASATDAVRFTFCTEAIAHTSECLNAAMVYTNLKNSGAKTFQYQDAKGNMQEMPIEDLLSMFSDELKDYVVKNGFNPSDKKSVKEVAEIGIKFWKERSKLYAVEGGQFDRWGALNESNKAKGDKYYLELILNRNQKSDEYNKMIDRMLEDVYIGNNTAVDLRELKDKIDVMSGDDALAHVLRGNGKSVDYEEVAKLADMVQNATEEDFALLDRYDNGSIAPDKPRITNKNEYFAKLASLGSKGVQDFFEYKQKAEESELVKELRAQNGELPAWTNKETLAALRFDREINKRGKAQSETEAVEEQAQTNADIVSSVGLKKANDGR